MIRWALGVAAAIALLLVVATIHQIREGGRAMAESDAAMARNDLDAAIARARAAAEAAAPASPYPPLAYERLTAIAQSAELHGDERTAIAAFSAMRAAAVETRAFGNDTSEWRARGDEGLARVGAGTLGPDGRASTEPRPAAAFLRDALAKDDTPPSWQLALLGLAAASFLGGAFRIALAGADTSALKRSPIAATATALGLVLYVVACLRG